MGQSQQGSTTIPAEGKTIYSDDPIIAEQGKFMDMMFSLQEIFDHMPHMEAIDKMAENEQFSKMLQPSPLELNNIVTILDRYNDQVIASYDWASIHQEESKIISENKDKFYSPSVSYDDQWNEFLSSGKQLVSSKHRNLEVATAVAIGTAVLPLAVESVKEFIGYVIAADTEISDYTAIYNQISNVKGVSAESNKLLDDAEDYALKARDEIRKAFMIVKAAALDLQAYL